LFRRFDHASPYQFLLRLKMNSAAERLQAPGVAVKQVAQEMGFSDPFHFSRVFKKALGLTPAQYVRLNRRV
jgi:AraC-like DNA-binding protein